MSASTAAAANARRTFFMSAEYHGSRPQLPEGREWLVTGNHSYVVTIWQDAECGRMASCRCEAYSFGQLCKHVRFAQLVDSLLTKSPVREIKPVYFS